jgi:hypothetical protein
MIQYGTGAAIVPGDPDVVEAQKAMDAQMAAAAAAEQSGRISGLVVLGVAVWMYMRWRKGKKLNLSSILGGSGGGGK